MINNCQLQGSWKCICDTPRPPIHGQKRQNVPFWGAPYEGGNAVTAGCKAQICWHGVSVRYIHTHHSGTLRNIAPTWSRYVSEVAHLTESYRDPRLVKTMLDRPQNGFSQAIRPQLDHWNVSGTCIAMIHRHIKYLKALRKCPIKTQEIGGIGRWNKCSLHQSLWSKMMYIVP